MQSTNNNFLKTILDLIQQLFSQIQIITNQIESTLMEIENSKTLSKIKEAVLVQSNFQQKDENNKQSFEDLLKIAANQHYFSFIEISFTCRVCKIQYQSIYQLFEHTKKWLQLFEHTKKCHSSQQSNLDQQQFQNQQQQEFKQQEFKQQEFKQDPIRPKSVCKICKKIFKNHYGLFMHKRVYHGLRRKTLKLQRRTIKLKMIQRPI